MHRIEDIPADSHSHAIAHTRGTQHRQNEVRAMPDTPGAERVAEVTRLFLQRRNPVGGREEAESRHRVDDEAFELDASIIDFSLEHVADKAGGKSEVVKK